MLCSTSGMIFTRSFLHSSGSSSGGAGGTTHGLSMVCGPCNILSRSGTVYQTHKHRCFIANQTYAVQYSLEGQCSQRTTLTRGCLSRVWHLPMIFVCDAWFGRQVQRLARSGRTKPSGQPWPSLLSCRLAFFLPRPAVMGPTGTAATSPTSLSATGDITVYWGSVMQVL